MTLPVSTGRLTIREFTTADLDGLAAVYSDPAVLWWEPEPFDRARTALALARILERYESDGIGEYALCLRSDGQLIGECGPVCREIDGERLPELGWKLRSDFWGAGYATEAARGVLPHVAETGIGRVYALITPGNVRSQGVARRIGMTIERRVDWAGLPHDVWALDVA